MPLYQGVKFIRQPGRMRKVKKARAAAFAVVTVALVTGILLIPTPLRVQGTLVLVPAKAAEVYAEVPGRLVALDVRDGEFVKSGASIARLSNPEKQLEYEQLAQQHDACHVKGVWYGSLSDTNSRALSQQNFQMERDLEPAITKISEQIAKLNLTAPRDGQVMGLPNKQTIGQYLKPGKPFAEVGDPHKLEAHLILDQSDVDLIRSQDPRNKPTAWVKIYGTSETTWKSYVGEVATRNREEIAPELSNLAGGEIATKQDEKTGQAKPLTAVYEVIIPIDNPDLELQPGLRGFAKIDGGHSTMAWWCWRMITKTFHFTL
jgi:putative peptide zinc metalloprotease protein